MGKSILLPLLLLLVSVASPAAGNSTVSEMRPGGGLDAACDKTMYPPFCALLLQPSAAQFADNDPKKMGPAAINAALERVTAMKSYLVGLGVKGTKNPQLKTAVMDCIDRLGRGETNLNTAVKVFPTATKADTLKEIQGASAEAGGCMEALQQAEGGADKAPVEGDPDVTMQAVRQANDTVRAINVAQTFVTMP